MGLAAMRVLSCACGVWHTAAVVQDCPGGGADALAHLTYLEGRQLQAKMADMYDMVDEVSTCLSVAAGGAAATWLGSSLCGRGMTGSLGGSGWLVGTRVQGLLTEQGSVLRSASGT